MVILVTNQDRSRLDVLTSLYVNMAFKEGKKDSAVYGIFNNPTSHEIGDAYATYTTKAKAKKVLADAIAEVVKPHFTTSKVLLEKLPNGFERFNDKKEPQQVYLIEFPKE